MVQVLNLEDYKSQTEPSEPSGVPSVVAMIWESKTRTYRVFVHIMNGDFEGIINVVREEGGTLHVVGEDRGVYLPWPPSYIDIIPEQNFDEAEYENQ